MRTLPPQPLKDQYWTDIEAQLKAVFYDLTFKPLVEILRKATPQTTELTNAGGNLLSLVAAIRTGRVQYSQGVFSGDFNVAIAKDLKTIGASFDLRSRVWRLTVGDVPDFVRAEAARYQSTAKATGDEIKRALDDIQINLERNVAEVDIDAEATIRAIEKGWKKAAKALQVQPTLTPEARQRLAEDYNKNLKLYIKDFSQQSVKNLRGAVEDNALDGYRFDKLIEDIRHRYGVTANKARFLARQETGLFMAKYRKERFSQAGVRRYRWSTAHDERVRDSHKHLNGRVFAYSDPPITDRASGAKNNPGEDFNCRCVDIPILEEDLSAA